MEITVIPIEEAVGLPLAHDLTEVDSGKKTKGARFKRGHILGTGDLPVLRRMGRRNLSFLVLKEDEVHEDDAALGLAESLIGEGLEISGPEEGRCRLVAKVSGVVRFDADAVRRINRDREWSFACCPGNAIVNPGKTVAAFRILPLCLKKDALERAKEAAEQFSVRPFMSLKVGLVSTGEEILSGLVRDAFREKLERKLGELGGVFGGQRICGDSKQRISEAIRELLEEGSDIVICSGGMSVDADDRTPEAIKSVADEILFRGVPAMPGSNLMLARRRGSWVVGAPACVAHDERTTLDRLLISLFAGLGEHLNVSGWGEGGLCSRCRNCIFPDCDFARLPSPDTSNTEFQVISPEICKV